MAKPRARDLGLDLPGEPGALNALTDIPGVLVGATTRIEGNGPLRQGHGPVRTGVTAILPRGREAEPMPVWAGIHALNGNGEMTGSHWIRDGGYFVGPVCVTNTHSVGIAHHAAVRWTIETYAARWGETHLWSMPVVAETYDGLLNDINGLHLTEADVRAALDGAAGGPVAEGNTGGGTGMIAYEWKGGTGTASRLVAAGGERFTVAALVQANHGTRAWFTPLGVPVGREWPSDAPVPEAELGSIIVILGTDAPMMPHQLHRLAKRAAIGIGRGGTPGGNNSGDIFLAFSTANARPLPQISALGRQSFDFLSDECFDPLYLGAVEAVEEAVLNAMLAAEDMSMLRPPGAICRAIEAERLCDIMRRYSRCR